MEGLYWTVIRELRRIKDAPNSHSKKNKVILSQLIQDIAELIAKAHVEMTTNRSGESLRKQKEFNSISNEN